MPDFQPFDRSSHDRRRVTEPTVTIRPRGIIAFSPAAIKALGKPEAVTFLIDTDARLLGFRATTVSRDAKGRRKADEDGAVIRGYPGLLSALPVLRHLGADLDGAHRYPLAEIDGVWCVDLKQPGIPVTSNRWGRGN